MSSRTNCPNTNTLEWKLLVEKHKGLELPAYKEWAELGDDYPADIHSKVEQQEGLSPKNESYSPDSNLLQREVVLQKSKTIIELKIAKLTNVMKKTPNLAKAELEFKELMKEMNSSDADIALHSFILAGDRMADSAVKWMKEIKADEEAGTLDKLAQINEFIQSFSIIDDIRKDFFNDPKHIEDFKIVNDISTKRKIIKNDFIDLARKALAREFAPHFSRVEEHYREQAQRDFGGTNAVDLKEAGSSKKEIAEAKKEYIAAFMRSEAVAIKFATLDYVNKMLMQTIDVPTTIAMAVNPKDMNHDIISIAVDQLDKADSEVQQATIAARNRLDRANAAFLKHVGKQGDPANQYAMFIVNDNEIINKKSKGWVEFKNKHQGTPVWDLYQELVSLIEEKDTLVPKWARIKYAIPSINKSNLERAYSNGVLETLKQGTIDHFKIKADDTDAGMVDLDVVEVEDKDKKKKKDGTIQTKEVVVSESGKEREVIPIYYRQPIAPADLSMDIVSSILLDYSNSLNFRTKTETAVVLDVLKGVVSEGDIKQQTSFSRLRKIRKGTEDVDVVRDAADSNVVKTLDHLIRHRIYGISVEGDPHFNKIIASIGNYTSIVGMAVNHISAVTNILQGSTMSTIEAMGNSTGLFNLKHKARAMVKYHSDDVGIIGDIGQRTPKSKTNKLIEKLNAFSEYHALDKRFMDNNTAKRMANLGTLMGMQSMGEHLVQSVVMYSILDNIKVKNADGKFLTKDFTPTDNRDEAISVDEAFDINEEGELEMHPTVASTERTDGVEDEDMRQISKLIRHSNRTFYGNYDGSNKSALQRTALGGQLFKMRGWLVPGIQKRWRGFGNISTAPGELDLDRKSFNAELGQFQEGTYVTALRFVVGLKKDVRDMKMMAVPENWNRLTDAEKGRIITALSEAAFAALALLVFGLAAGGDDPEDVYIALYSRRLFSELATFANPIEGLRTLRSPAVGLSTIESALKLTLQGTGDTYSMLTGGEAERYKSGRRKGELKINKKLIKLIPIWKQLDRTAEESLDFLLQ